MAKLDVAAILPHRAPFLFIDEIVSVAGEDAHCRFRIPGDGGSFAARMFLELMLVEALAQTTAVHVGATSPDEGPAVGLLGGIEDLVLERSPRPGEQVELRCHRVRRLGPIAMYEVSASCGSEPVCRGTLTVRSGGVP